MTTLEAVQKRLDELMRKSGMNPHSLSISAAVAPGTLKSILNGESQNPVIVTLKKLCDGFSPPVSLDDFFDSELFRGLEQEIE